MKTIGDLKEELRLAKIDKWRMYDKGLEDLYKMAQQHSFTSIDEYNNITICTKLDLLRTDIILLTDCCYYDEVREYERELYGDDDLDDDLDDIPKPNVIDELDNILKKNFNETQTCKMCGSQRCDGSNMWLKGCKEYKKYTKHSLEALLEKYEDS